MNKVFLMGRLTRDPEIHGEGDKKVANFTLAVDRYVKGEKTADFISCKAFRDKATTIETYVRKGTKIAVDGNIQTGSYTKQDGTKVYTTDVIVDRFEFCESRNQSQEPSEPNDPVPPKESDWMQVPDTDNEELPFK